MSTIVREQQIAENKEKVLSDDIYDILKWSYSIYIIGMCPYMGLNERRPFNDCGYHRLIEEMRMVVVNTNQINVVGGVFPFLEKYRDMVYTFKNICTSNNYTSRSYRDLTIDKVCEKLLSIIADICIKKINSDIDRELEIIKKIGFNRVAVFKEDTAALEDVLCVAYRAFELIDKFALHPKYKQEIYIPTRDTLIDVCILYGVDKKVKTQKKWKL